jgi:hypothetical protein
MLNSAMPPLSHSVSIYSGLAIQADPALVPQQNLNFFISWPDILGKDMAPA